MKKASPSLMKIIKFTMALLVPAALIALTVWLYALRQNDEENFQRQDSILRYQTIQTASGLTQVNYYLTDMIANDTNIQQ